MNSLEASLLNYRYGTEMYSVSEWSKLQQMTKEANNSFSLIQTLNRTLTTNPSLVATARWWMTLTGISR